MKKEYVQKYKWLVVGFKADCLAGDLGLWMGCPPWGSFYKDTNDISRKTCV